MTERDADLMSEGGYLESIHHPADACGCGGMCHYCRKELMQRLNAMQRDIESRSQKGRKNDRRPKTR